MIQTSIITIGDELLIGQVIDTNSAWMAQQLNKSGIRVVRRIAVGDVWDEIWNALDQESKQADIILITGGLGPTADDITKPLLCKYFSGKMVVDDGALQNVINIFTNILKRPIIERNLKQAEVPDNCKVLLNKNGTAPGMWFEKGGKIFVSMPGVPNEMKGMMQDDVIPLLNNYFQFPHIAHRTLLTAGVGESFIAEMIEDFEKALPKHIKLAYLPNYGMVRLRLSSSGSEKQSTEDEIQHYFISLQDLVKDFLVTNKDEPMQQVVANLLVAKNKTISTAESCTGGYIAHLLTQKAGASAYFSGSIISYSYKAKESLLDVNRSVLDVKGAVSEEVVIQMAKGALKALKTDYTIAVSGIMGPDGAMKDKPVGTVWIAVGNFEQIVTQKFTFNFDRTRNIELTATFALNMLRKFILSNI
jgi:nicotinamide-nucleotide amidase